MYYIFVKIITRAFDKQFSNDEIDQLHLNITSLRALTIPEYRDFDQAVLLVEAILLVETL